MVTLTRKDAEFKQSKTQVNYKNVGISKQAKKVYDTIKKDNIYKEVIADSAVKVMSKLQQVTGGFVYADNGDTYEFKNNKLKWLKAQQFSGMRVAVYARYTYEIQLLLSELKNTTSSYVEFKNMSEGIFVTQVKNGS